MESDTSTTRTPVTLRRLLHPAYHAFRTLVSPLQPSKYGIRAGYSHRRNYHYFDDRSNTDTWQREVYQRAADIMTAKGMRSVADIGCGSAYKLIQILGQFDTVGVDVSPTYEWLLEKYPERRWVKSFTEESEELRPDLVICADVIEHVLDPDALLAYIARLSPRRIVISTPERDLVYRRHHWGPPTNPSHIREWSFSEFADYVSRHFVIHEHVVSNKEQFTQMIVASPK